LTFERVPAQEIAHAAQPLVASSMDKGRLNERVPFDTTQGVARLYVKGAAGIRYDPVRLLYKIRVVGNIVPEYNVLPFQVPTKLLAVLFDEELLPLHSTNPSTLIINTNHTIFPLIITISFLRL